MEKVLMDINDICATLPHRYPFLLVDKIIAMENGTFIRGIKNVTMNEPFFMGHFPDYPVMPGVLVIEALAQAAVILAYKSGASKMPNGERGIILFAGIDEARFKRQVIPGDVLVLEAEMIRTARGIGKYKARALVEGQVACEAVLMAALRPPLRSAAQKAVDAQQQVID
ncbi:MAG: 3-hydroxyacyl-ACP dehydratase FabZ [Burkholderiales bacterium]|jgi:3-hydroxyacyl-[acyl-carrier-protein] dehydratase|nr:3-hydroxyacyl-ACP dehydratase FabZ [Burkholderiales bacterium]